MRRTLWLSIALLLVGCGGSGLSINTPVTTATSIVPQAIPRTPTIAPASLPSPIDQDKQSIATSVTDTLQADAVWFHSTDLSTVNYSSVGWKQREPLIREITLNANGVLSIYFSAGSTGDSYIDVSDYNLAEEAIVFEILPALRSLQLNTPLADITVAAWAPLPVLSACQTLRIDRMAFVRLTQAQLAATPFDQWGDLSGQQMFDQMAQRGISNEINRPYKVCRPGAP